MAQIAHLVRIRAEPESVYRRVASTAGIAEWFTQAFSPDYCEGGTLELRFSDEPVSFTIAALALQVANVVTFAAPWPHLACLTLDLLICLALFLRLATVAFSGESSRTRR